MALALVVNLGAALSAGAVDPVHNDLLLHGQLVERSAAALQADGWGAFQDPWFPELNGGYPVFHQYPHLPHQWTAAVATVTRVDPWAALGWANLLVVALLPLLAWLGARWLGLQPLAASLAAVVLATARCADGFGGTPLEFGFGGHGLFGQLWGVAFALVALPAWVAASVPSGGGLGRLPVWGRVLLAAVLGSFVVRSSLPAAWVLALLSLAVVCAAGPVGELPKRLGRFVAAGIGVAVLSAGFLVPFAADLAATNASAIEMAPEQTRSVGILAVIGRLLTGYWLDGGIPVPWSLLLLGAFGWIGWTWRDQPNEVRGVAVGTVVALLLLAGRETWGGWINALPVVGRFHDHRYLLGLHLLAPAAIGAAAASALPRLELKPRLGVLAGVVALAVLRQVVAGAGDRQERADAEAALHEARPQLDSLLQRATAADGRVALALPDHGLGGTTRLAWLRRNGLPTFGRPLFHYAFTFEFAMYWTEQVAGGGADAGDRLAAGVASTLDGDEPVAITDAAVVRSDLLVEADGSDLDGFAVAWFAQGLHAGRQYPTIDVGVGARPDRGSYRRHGRIADRDPALLADLPAAREMGEVLSSEPGERAGDRTVRARIDRDHAWLMVATSWHPKWSATVDGRPADHFMLTPGWIGLPLPEGEHEVQLTWRSAPWRGPWAAGNIAACLLCLVAAVMSRRDFEVSS